MDRTKRTVIAVACVAVVFVVLTAVATVYDFNITAALADLKEGQYISSNVFGRIFETVGETPIYLLCIFAADLIFQNFNRRRGGALRIVAIVLSLFAMTALSAYMIHKITGYIAVHFDAAERIDSVAEKIGSVAFGVVFTAAVVYFSRGIKSSLLNKLFFWALIVIATAALSQIIAQTVKMLSGRARYRTMNALDDFQLFTKWYVFNGSRTPDEAMLAKGVASDGFKSFPSGHTAAAAMLICLTALPDFLGKGGKRIKIVVWSVFGGFTAIVMLSRLIMGAHFLSDVLIACLITVVSFYICAFAVPRICGKILKLPLLPEAGGARLTEESVPDASSQN